MQADPRLPQLLHSLLSGLAAKIREYQSAGTPGFTASWRRVYAFVKQRGYPSMLCRRPLAKAAMRQITTAAKLPRALRCALLATDFESLELAVLDVREQ